ncbi:hypothetical protein KR093_002668 [Drosophila rubida]|uniref:Uncharacterized protein n=1 Tax=Drosophila rubida TaxID=30044 RepID=A0AAD4K6F4_9MUSC|nr:hypothetical protein KR093_002668 [Drosophila rubida]
MFNKCLLAFEVLILLQGFATAVNYRFEIENEEIMTPCQNQPSNVKDITEFFDMSEIQTKDAGGKIIVSGNLTSKFNFQLTDRIQGTGKVYRYERREWVPSLFSMSVQDVCSVLYDERQHWYRFWTQHVLNVKDIKSKCVLNGTKIIHEQFEVDLNVDLPLVTPAGQHKLVIVIEVVDEFGKVREPTLCFEILGELIRKFK